jgi:hypothetical protein
VGRATALSQACGALRGGWSCMLQTHLAGGMDDSVISSGSVRKLSCCMCQHRLMACTVGHWHLLSSLVVMHILAVGYVHRRQSSMHWCAHMSR